MIRSNLTIVQDGQLSALAVNKRDASRYGLRGTGTTVGGAGQLPSSGFGHLAALPTAETLSDLVGPDGAILVWFVAGGDCARAGDLALPARCCSAWTRRATSRGGYPVPRSQETSWMSSASPTSAAPASGSTRTVTRATS